MESRAERARDRPGEWGATLRALAEDECPAFELELRQALDDTDGGLELALLRDVRIWLDRVHHQIREMGREIDAYAPWAPLLRAAPEGQEALARELEALLPLSLPLCELETRVEKAQERLASETGEPATESWREGLAAAIEAGATAAVRLRGELLERAAEAEAAALGMDFRWLYDSQTRLLHIGYNVSAALVPSGARHHADPRGRVPGLVGRLDVRVPDARAAATQRSRNPAGPERALGHTCPAALRGREAGAMGDLRVGLRGRRSGWKLPVSRLRRAGSGSAAGPRR
jgi:hypothetical protein